MSDDAVADVFVNRDRTEVIRSGRHLIAQEGAGVSQLYLRRCFVTMKHYVGLLTATALLTMGLGMVFGFVLMLLSRLRFREFFARKTEAAAPGMLDVAVEHAPAHF